MLIPTAMENNIVTSNSEQGMVLVMGITGSGKSYFVNQLKAGAVAEGDTLESCMCQP
jgi:Tfp pilus assembly pilus retraction ATPase PilT